MTPAAAAFDADVQDARFYTLLAGERRLRAVAPVLAALRQADVPAIVLKGAAFAQNLYADCGLRPFSDVDLLVRASDVPRARQALADCGLTPERPEYADDEAAHDCQITFVQEDALGDGEPLVVELHWNLLNNDRLLHAAGRIDPERFWGASEAATVAGEPVRVLSPAHTLLHLCLHLAGHGLDAPMSVRDMAVLLAGDQGGRVDWQALIADARAFRITTIVWAGLLLAVQARRAPVPEAVLRSLRPGPPRRRTLSRWVARAADGEAAGEAVAGLFLPLLLDTPRSAAACVAATLFPPRRWLADRYPATSVRPLAPLYLRHHRDLARLALGALRRDDSRPEAP